MVHYESPLRLYIHHTIKSDSKAHAFFRSLDMASCEMTFSPGGGGGLGCPVPASTATTLAPVDRVVIVRGVVVCMNSIMGLSAARGDQGMHPSTRLKVDVALPKAAGDPGGAVPVRLEERAALPQVLRVFVCVVCIQSMQ